MTCLIAGRIQEHLDFDVFEFVQYIVKCLV